MHADLMTPDQASNSMLQAYQLVGFGSGIYYGRHHASILAIAGRPNVAPGSAFIYSTAGLPFLSQLWHWPLRRRLQRSGWCIAGEFSCRGWDCWGPLRLIGGLNRRRPDERDLVRARTFAQSLLSR
jgi:flavodoxin